MALGNSYNNNASKEVKDPSIYSAYKYNNAESKVDQTSITFTYWNNSIKVSINPRKQTGDGQIAFDYENSISVYLNRDKARIFADEIKNFINDPERFDNSGVASGQGLITVSRGVEYGSESPIITIRKVNENGEVMSSFAYQTKDNYYFSIRNYKEDGTFEKCIDDYKYFELKQIIVLLEEFCKAVTTAVAYTVMDQLKYEHYRQRGVLNAIAKSLGVEYGGRTNESGRSYSSTSYFNKASGSDAISKPSPGYTSASLDDIED